MEWILTTLQIIPGSVELANQLETVIGVADNHDREVVKRILADFCDRT